MTPAKDEISAQSHATIMMVDDEPITMEFVQVFLEQAGYRKFVVEEDSTRAISVMEKAMPDILLLDLVMPGVSGFDILALVREHEVLRHLPVVVLTSSSDNQTRLKALELGATDFLSKPVDPSELVLRVRNTLAVKAYQDQLAFYDPLTNLPNRRMFMNVLDRTLKKGFVEKKNVALLSIELDKFDRITDTMGMSVSDEVLIQVSQRIEKVIRSTDDLATYSSQEQPEFDLARFDRGTFFLLLYPLHADTNAALVGERLSAAINAPLTVETYDLDLTVSIGIAIGGKDLSGGDNLIDEAARAKDHAGQMGGDRIQFASETIGSDYAKRQSIRANLRRAVDRDELALVFQPKVSMATGRVLGVETLLRWNSAEIGPVCPAEFIPIAEESGLINGIGEWLLKESCRVLYDWQQRFCEPFTLAVNLSTRQFIEPGFLDMAKSIIADSRIDVGRLTLELTESLLLREGRESIKKLQQLRDIGVTLSIDDFGTGYSSLSYLEQLPVDELKIDRSFVINIADSKRSEAIVRSVVILAHGLGLKTVVEGIEEERQREVLQDCGCDTYQGYLFSHPVSQQEVEMLFLAQQEAIEDTGT